MLNHSKDGLQIFDAFQIDHSLPKWESRRKAHHTKLSSGNPELVAEAIMEASGPSSTPAFMVGVSTRWRNNSGTFISAGVVPVNGIMQSNGVGSDGSVDNSKSKKSKESVFKRMFGRKKAKSIADTMGEQAVLPNFETVPLSEVPEENLPSPMQIIEFFKSVKNSASELKIIEERYKSFEIAHEYLKKTGQKAVLETVSAEIEIYRSETQLFAAGFKRLITEQNAIEFAKKAPRKVKLDWIQNYVRSIPEKITNEKVKLDEKNIFDNYVIMHYDPDGKGSEMTEQDKQRAKDPILFGVIAGSTKLYYIGDWIDEYCDLTFDKMIEVLGKKAINANDLSAKVEINTK